MRSGLSAWWYQWWLLALLAAFVPLTASLGFWQLNRADEKTQLLNEQAARGALTPSEITLTLEAFSPVHIEGTLTGQHYWWDSRTHEGQVGYELLVVVALPNGPYRSALVNLGFVADSHYRTQLPEVPTLPEQVNWNTQVRLLDLHWLEAQLFPVQLGVLPDDMAPVLFEIDAAEPEALMGNWEQSAMGPARHLGYAVQWFALAAVLFIGAVLLIWKHRARTL